MNISKLKFLPTRQLARRFSITHNVKSTGDSYKFLVLGGGTGGLSVASYLSRKFPNQVAVVEPSEMHYYQPMWTLVGAGIKDAAQSMRPMASVMPPKAQWIKERAASFDPDENFVITNANRKINYDFLVISLGLQLDFHKIPGLSEALGTDGVACNYSIKTVNDTYKALQNFEGGNAFFTLPATPVKCLGAPQKIMYLAEHYFREKGVRDKTNVVFKTPGGVLFAIEKYKQALLKVCASRDIQIDLFRNLINIDADKKEATFEFVDDTNSPKKTETLDYNFIHVTPPMGPVDVLKTSSLVDAAGFVDVDKETCQHVKYSNIFSLGDASSLPISKTAAAVSTQSQTVRKNIMSALKGKELTAKYTGYSSCPVITSPTTCILAEFDYSGLPRETFPFDQGKERRSMYHMKADLMPQLYWNGLIKGIWPGPELTRKILHLGCV